MGITKQEAEALRDRARREGVFSEALATRWLEELRASKAVNQDLDDSDDNFTTFNIIQMAADIPLKLRIGQPYNEIIFAFADKFGIDEALRRWDGCFRTKHPDDEKDMAILRRELKARAAKGRK